MEELLVLRNDSVQSKETCPRNNYEINSHPTSPLVALNPQQLYSKSTDILKDDFKAILDQLRIKEGDELVDHFELIFKSRIPKDILELETAKKNQNYIGIGNKAHYLTTTLLTLKFKQGLDITAQLEKVVKENQKASILLLTDQLVDYLNSALKAIK